MNNHNITIEKQGRYIKVNNHLFQLNKSNLNIINKFTSFDKENNQFYINDNIDVNDLINKLNK